MWIHIGLFECILSFNNIETTNVWINIYYILMKTNKNIILLSNNKTIMLVNNE